MGEHKPIHTWKGADFEATWQLWQWYFSNDEFLLETAILGFGNGSAENMLYIIYIDVHIRNVVSPVTFVGS